MSRIVKVQTNFTNGEFDPLLFGRLDIKQRFNALAKARNVLVQPQGGLARRPGLQFINDVGAVATDIDEGARLVAYEFSTTQSYMLLFTHNKMFVFKDKALITDINGTGNNYLVTTIGKTLLSTIDWAQSADTLIVVHEDLAPQKIVRGASDSAWTIAAITFVSIPKYAFTLATSEPAGTLTPNATSGTQIVATSGSVFSSGSVGQYLEKNDGLGRFRITRYISATNVEGTTEIPFFSTAAIASGDWTYETGYEDSWSSSKGYPRTVCFYQGRLYFGGTKNRPTTVFASRVGDYYDFNLGEALDADAIVATMDTDSANPIMGIFPGRDMQVFTQGGEFYVAQGEQDPLTPSNFVIKSATKRGMKAGIKPVGAESGTYFIQRTGKAVREFLFSDSEMAYVTPNISLLSSHLISTPTDMALRKATSTTDGDLLCLVNSTDGSLATYSLLKGQAVVAPSLCTTNGSFINVAVDVDTLYFVVKRQLPLYATCTITVTDYSNIATGATIVLTKNDGTTVTFTCQGPGSSPTPETNKFFHNESNDTTADNIFTCINLHDDFSAANPAANVVTVTRAVAGGENLTVTSSDGTRLAVTNFVNGTTDKYYVEAFNDDFTTDGAVQFTSAASDLPSSTTVNSGIAHLEKYPVKVVVDDGMQTDQTVTSGVITLDALGSTYVEIGLDFDIQVKTMPVETQIQAGLTNTILPFKKRLLESTVVLYLTQNLTLEGNDFEFYDLGTYEAGDPIPFFTGQKRRYPMTKYDEYGQLTLAQSQPLYFTLLAIEYQVSTET